MRYYIAAPYGTDRRDRCLAAGFGLLYSPTYRKTPRPCECGEFVLDNGAFSAYKRGAPWDGGAFYSLVDRIERDGISPAFVVLPDIVAGGVASIARSIASLPRLPQTWRKYLPVQDGMAADHVDPVIPDVDGLFVGGTVGWKWRTARDWVELAHQHGRSCHIGRVNSSRQILTAHRVGADSVDGSTASRHHSIDRLIRHYVALQEQGAIA